MALRLALLSRVDAEPAPSAGSAKPWGGRSVAAFGFSFVNRGRRRPRDADLKIAVAILIPERRPVGRPGTLLHKGRVCPGRLI
jgi:hypothetical protein